MKKKYVRLEVNVIELDLTDICTTSGDMEGWGDAFIIGDGDEIGSFIHETEPTSFI